MLAERETAILQEQVQRASILQKQGERASNRDAAIIRELRAEITVLKTEQEEGIANADKMKVVMTRMIDARMIN